MTRNRTREVGGHVPDVVPTEVPRDVTELSESTSASVVGRKSPDIVPDSEEEFERTQPVTMERGRDETKDEHEVESMIRSCSIHDNTAGPLQSPKFPSSPNAMWIDEEQGVEPLQLQYPDSSDQEQMERTSPEAVTFGLQSSEGETDGPKSAIKLNRISTESFYQSISAKGKEKEISHQLPPVEPPVPDEDEPVTPEAADAGAQV